MRIKIRLFEKLDIFISESDWDFLCNHRFFTDTPSIDEIDAEFVSGTVITSKKISELQASKMVDTEGKNASEKFSEYIHDLRKINTFDINGMARDLLSDTEIKNNEIDRQREERLRRYPLEERIEAFNSLAGCFAHIKNKDTLDIKKIKAEV